MAAILFLLCAGVSAFVGWKTASDLTQRGAVLYMKTQGADSLHPFDGDFRTHDAVIRVALRDHILNPMSPAARHFHRLLWRMGFFAVLCGVAIGVPFSRR